VTHVTAAGTRSNKPRRDRRNWS